MRGLFVTGTDTGVGKTIVAASLLAAMRAAGESPVAHKPVLTGIEQTPVFWPPDHLLLALAADMEPGDVVSEMFAPALSPHLAARLEGRTLDGDALVADALAKGRDATIVVEGIGGLLVPLNETMLVRDFARALALPLVVAARPGLGTINHTLLTLEAARAAGLQVAAVVLTPWPREPGDLQRSNRETIEALGAVEVATLGEVQGPAYPALAAAGEELPWRRWLDQPAAAAAQSA